MDLFRLPRKKHSLGRIDGEGVYLRPARDVDFEPGESCAPKPQFPEALGADLAADDLTRTAFQRRLSRQDRERSEDQSYGFLVFSVLG